MDAPAFLLIQHARLHSAEVAEAESPSFADRVFGGLADDVMRLRPAKGLNSLAWLLWHMARTEDVAVNRVIGAGPQVLDDGDWPQRLGVPRRDIGTGMTEDEVAELGARVDLVALRAYRTAVGRRTREVARTLAPAQWDEVIGPSDIARAATQGAFGPEAGWVGKIWQGRARGSLLGSYAIAHNAMHLGEAISVRGQAGFGLGL